MRRTKIVATIGPASDDPTTLKRMIEAGMNVARIGLAHGTIDEHIEKYKRIRAAADALDTTVGILIDLPGPKVRAAAFPEGGVMLDDGQPFRLTVGEKASTKEVVSVDYESIVADVMIGDKLAFGDGNITFTVEGKSNGAVDARILRGGNIQGRPGVQVPSDRLSISTPTDEDLRAVDAFHEYDVDMIAISFVRSAHDVRMLGIEAAPHGPMVVAKIETQAAVDNLEGIIEASGAVMVARGDLGLEFPLSELPHLQKHIIQRCVALGRPVITATQMLESMVYAPAPTRAEASDVANAVFDGSSAVMLSGESAVGVDPVNAVATMAEITGRADEGFDHDAWARDIGSIRAGDGETDFGAVTTDALTFAAVKISEQVQAKAIICLSRTGFTVRSVSRFRPRARIVGFSPMEQSVGQLTLSWGATAELSPERTTAKEMIDDALAMARNIDGLNPGDRVVVISGHSTAARATDTLRVMNI